jgi:hypothetical protein
MITVRAFLQILAARSMAQSMISSDYKALFQIGSVLGTLSWSNLGGSRVGRDPIEQLARHGWACPARVQGELFMYL